MKGRAVPRERRGRGASSHQRADRRRPDHPVQGRLGRSRRAHGEVPAGSFVEVLPDDGTTSWHVLASCDDPRDEVRSGWDLWARTASEVSQTLRAMDVVWLDLEVPSHTSWPFERLRLVAPPLVLRTPWSGLASSLLWGIFVVLACVIVWYQDVPVWPLIGVIAGAWLVGSVRRITATLTVEHDGVTVRNTWRSRHLAWEDIEAVGTAAPVSLWNAKLTSVLHAVAFRVRGRRFLLKAAGTATQSGNRLIEQYAAVRPWCLTAGVPADRELGDPDGLLRASGMARDGHGREQGAGTR